MADSRYFQNKDNLKKIDLDDAATPSDAITKASDYIDLADKVNSGFDDINSELEDAKSDADHLKDAAVAPANNVIFDDEPSYRSAKSYKQYIHGMVMGTNDTFDNLYQDAQVNHYPANKTYEEIKDKIDTDGNDMLSDVQTAHDGCDSKLTDLKAMIGSVESKVKTIATLNKMGITRGSAIRFNLEKETLDDTSGEFTLSFSRSSKAYQYDPVTGKYTLKNNDEPRFVKGKGLLLEKQGYDGFGYGGNPVQIGSDNWDNGPDGTLTVTNASAAPSGLVNPDDTTVTKSLNVSTSTGSNQYGSFYRQLYVGLGYYDEYKSVLAPSIHILPIENVKQLILEMTGKSDNESTYHQLAKVTYTVATGDFTEQFFGVCLNNLEGTFSRKLGPTNWVRLGFSVTNFIQEIDKLGNDNYNLRYIVHIVSEDNQSAKVATWRPQYEDSRNTNGILMPSSPIQLGEDLREPDILKAPVNYVAGMYNDKLDMSIKVVEDGYHFSNNVTAFDSGFLYTDNSNNEKYFIVSDDYVEDDDNSYEDGSSGSDQNGCFTLVTKHNQSTGFVSGEHFIEVNGNFLIDISSYSLDYDVTILDQFFLKEFTINKRF